MLKAGNLIDVFLIHMQILAHSKLYFVAEIQQIEPIFEFALGLRKVSFWTEFVWDTEGMLSSLVVLPVSSCAGNGQGFGSTGSKR